MSAYSDWKVGALSDAEYRSAMKRECKDWPPDGEFEYHYTCQDCEFYKIGYRFFREIGIREADQKEVIKTTKKYCYMDLCTKDIEMIREINSYDDICEDHGELFREDE